MFVNYVESFGQQKNEKVMDGIKFYVINALQRIIMSKIIKLTQEHETIVDDDDYEWIINYNCYAQKIPKVHGKDDVYAMIGMGKGRAKQLHRVINNTPDGVKTDHKNNDTLDNRK